MFPVVSSVSWRRAAGHELFMRLWAASSPGSPYDVSYVSFVSFTLSRPVPRPLKDDELHRSKQPFETENLSCDPWVIPNFESMPCRLTVGVRFGISLAPTSRRE